MNKTNICPASRACAAAHGQQEADEAVAAARINASTPALYVLAHIAEELAHRDPTAAQAAARTTRYSHWRDAIETAIHTHRVCACGRAVWMCSDCADGRDVGHSHAECGACAECLAAAQDATP